MSKGFKEFIKEDPSLSEKHTYDDFIRKKSTAPTNNDVPISEAYESFCEERKKLEKV